MGVKLIILLALVLGVLYVLHLLARDYQAVTAPRLLRLLFKRDLAPPPPAKPSVHWARILRHDAAQCARLLYCGLGEQAAPAPPAQRATLRAGLTRMLKLEPRAEDQSALAEFRAAYAAGAQRAGAGGGGGSVCTAHFPRCPFAAATLESLLDLVLNNQIVTY